MARVLLISFLGVIVVWGITAVVVFFSVVLGVLPSLIHLLETGHWVDPKILLYPSPEHAWVLFASVLFFVLLPALILLLLFLGVIRGGRRKTGIGTQWYEITNRRVAVVLTAFDDEESVGQAVDQFRRVVPQGIVYVVDNNSRDRTAEVAREHGAIVVHESRQGYGYACMKGLRTALSDATNEIIILAEGDMTFNARDTLKMLPYLEDCDMVIGTRTNYVLTNPGSQMDWFLSWGNLFLALLVRLRFWNSWFLGRVQLTDVGCTFRTIRRSALERMIDDLTIGSMEFSPHMILVALKNGLSIIEVPIRFQARVGRSKGAGASRLRAIRIGLQMLKEITFQRY